MTLIHLLWTNEQKRTEIKNTHRCRTSVQHLHSANFLSSAVSLLCCFNHIFVNLTFSVCSIRTILGCIWLRWSVTIHWLHRPGFDNGSVHVKFVVEKKALRQVFLWVLLFSPVNIIPTIHLSLTVNSLKEHALLHNLEASLFSWPRKFPDLLTLHFAISKRLNSIQNPLAELANVCNTLPINGHFHYIVRRYSLWTRTKKNGGVLKEWNTQFTIMWIKIHCSYF
jgi:hypothetical protein